MRRAVPRRSPARADRRRRGRLQAARDQFFIPNTSTWNESGMGAGPRPRPAGAGAFGSAGGNFDDAVYTRCVAVSSAIVRAPNTVLIVSTAVSALLPSSFITAM